MSDFELAPGRVLHFNESSWDALQGLLATNHFTLMAQHVAEQRRKDVVVLDPAVLASKRPIQEWLRDAVRLLRRDHQNTVASIVEGFVDQIEAQTKRARIPEPGLWGVAEARTERGNDTCTWVRNRSGWQSDCGESARWDSLIDPTLIRDGVES